MTEIYLYLKVVSTRCDPDKVELCQRRMTAAGEDGREKRGGGGVM